MIKAYSTFALWMGQLMCSNKSQTATIIRKENKYSSMGLELWNSLRNWLTIEFFFMSNTLLDVGYFSVICVWCFSLQWSSYFDASEFMSFETILK